jgi:hypothetical protein
VSWAFSPSFQKSGADERWSISAMRFSRVGRSKIPPERFEPLSEGCAAFFQLVDFDRHG